MIVHLASGRLEVEELEQGTTLIVDADWLPPSRSGVVTPLVLRDGSAALDDGRTAPLTLPDDHIASAIALVGDVLGEIERLIDGSGHIEVVGSGVVARSLRRSAIPGPSQTIVDGTGRTDSLRAALQRLPDRGLLVVAGESPDVVDLDLYDDIHLRGLRLVVAPRILDAAHAQTSLRIDPPTEVRPGDVLAGEAWYAIRS